MGAVFVEIENVQVADPAVTNQHFVVAAADEMSHAEAGDLASKTPLVP